MGFNKLTLESLWVQTYKSKAHWKLAAKMGKTSVVEQECVHVFQRVKVLHVALNVFDSRCLCASYPNQREILQRFTCLVSPWIFFVGALFSFWSLLCYLLQHYQCGSSFILARWNAYRKIFTKNPSALANTSL